jgi:Ca2+-transporting ATPase
MGLRGSDVSREVADLVLLDDNFATIVAAIKEGRNIYENIQKFIRFLFAANFALTLIVIVGALGTFLMNLRDASGGLLLPLTAMQLLWINVITNGPPAVVLGLDRNHGLMRRRPRDPSSPLLDAASLSFIVIVGGTSALIGGLLLITLSRLGYGLTSSRTLLFLFASISQLLLVYPARRIIASPLTNLGLHASVILCVGLQMLTVFVPGLRLVLGLELPEGFGLIWAGAAVLLSFSAAETYVRLRGVGLSVGIGRKSLTWSLSWARRIVVAIIGFTVLLFGIALIVLPGPAFIVIPLGLAILATEFVWARSLLQRARATLVRTKGRTVS